MRVFRIIPLLTIVAILACGTARAVSYPFADDFESGVANWSTNGLWGLTSGDAHSPSESATDSPGRFYTNNTDAALELASAMNLSGATTPVLTFHHRHSLEDGYDEGTVEISTDGGVSWISPALMTYTGNLGTWTREQLDLGTYAGQADVRVRFRLQTDGSIVKDGWHVDDVAAGEAPAAVGTVVASSSSPTAVKLNWTPSAGPNLAQYRVFRSRQPGIDWRTGRVIAELGGSTTNYTDVAVSPKTTYYYRVMALDTSERHALSAEPSITTLAGMDFPFLDNGEGGGATWNAEAPWALSDEDALSPTRAWSDSPGTNYANSANASLTLAAAMDLSDTVAPAFCFVHKYEFASGDSGNAEISLNGSDWSSLAQFTGSSGDAWQQARHDLGAYVGKSTVYVRLRFTSDHANVADGWHVDDISVGESPGTINAPVITEVASHSMRLTWTASTNDHFSHYAVHQSTATGVDFNDTLVTTITERAAVTCVAGGLALDTEYYFRVYEVSAYGIYSADGTENHDHTLNHPMPFTEDFEGSLEGWNLTGTWGVETNRPFAGTYNLADTPGNATYVPSSDSSAQTAVDLTGSSWPVLRFRDRYDIAAGDKARVEVSTDGSGWSRIYGIMEGTRTNWSEQILDLSEWKTAPNLRIRFRLYSDSGAATTGDGWMIDALSVEEHTPLALTVPFHEGFENGLSNWLHAAWEVATNEAYVGSASVVNGGGKYLPGEYSEQVGHRLSLGGPLDLSGMTNPQLTFWVKGHILSASYGYFRVHISNNDGLTWTERTEANLNMNFNADWTRIQCDLTPYAGQSVRMSFWIAGHRYTPDIDIYVDKVTLEERPPNASLNAPVPHLKSVDLNWNASTLGPAFQRYELRRDTGPNVDLNDLLLGQFTDVSSNAFTDTGLSIGQTYYYRLFVVNTNDTYSAGSERAATTVPIALGFSDPMETVDNWDVTGNWGVDSNRAHQGSACLSDSPGDLYAPSVDGWILTAVDLSGSSWPVLRFRDRYEVGAGDKARVEVSTDGSGWSRIYGIMEGTRTNWSEQILDLSEWKTAPNLRIRFRLYSDSGAATTGDGWMIDALSVEEHTPLALTVPFHEGFENGLSNWLHAAWEVATNEAYVGSASVVNGGGKYLPGEYSEQVGHRLSLGGPLDLSGMTNPQLTFWVKGHILSASYGYFRVHISNNDGLTWTERTEANLNMNFNADWTRIQCDLTPYAGQSVRMSFWIGGHRYTPDIDIYVDKVTLEERPPDATLHALVPHSQSIDLSWDMSGLGSTFLRYEVRRDVNAGVNLADTLVAAFTNISTLAMTDTGLTTGTRYYYRLYVVNTNDTYSAGAEQSAIPTPLRFGFTDPMESLDRWIVTGSWGVDSNAAHSGTACISDSPRIHYGPNSDTWLLTSVDLTGSDWPVLRFWDRFQLAGGDWGRVEISTDGNGWVYLYGLYDGTRTNWTEQVIDLSEWKNHDNLRIRFRVGTDSSAATTADGWMIDDVSVIDHTPATISYPFFDGFENDMGNWLHAPWRRATNETYAGSACVVDGDTQYMPGGYNEHISHRLVLGAALDLSNAVAPKLTFWFKGHLTSANYLYFRVHASTDGGLTWQERTEANYGSFDMDWTRVQCDLSSYIGQTVRLRFYVGGHRYTPNTEVYIDNIGIGEPTPGATTLHSPLQLESVPVLRPTLRVVNAIDFQGDALDYEFEIYSDSLLSNLVASVPAVAQGVNTTTWTVDTDLPDNAQYWWRCRAADAGGPGPWMDTAIFYVAHVNSPPHPVVLAGPPPASILHELTHELVWRPTTDPDTGGEIVAYHLQVSRDLAFTNNPVDDATIDIGDVPTGQQWTASMPLSSFAGSDSLIENTSYFWRMRASDQWDSWSDWSTNAIWFIYGTPPPTIGEMAPQPDGSFEMNWERSGKAVYIEHSATLTPADWQPVAGPIYGTNSVVTPPPGSVRGFYRTRTE